jgi:hypothetical protein
MYHFVIADLRGRNGIHFRGSYCPNTSPALIVFLPDLGAFGANMNASLGRVQVWRFGRLHLVHCFDRCVGDVRFDNKSFPVVACWSSGDLIVLW